MLANFPTTSYAPSLQLRAAAELELRRRQQSPATATLSFRDFVHQANPGFRFYRHVEILIPLLQKVADGELTRLMIFWPPRHGKSELISRLFTAYYLYCHPERWVGLTSYGANLAYSFSRNARDNYRRIGRATKGDAAAVEQWETGGGGGLWAAGVGGGITGRGFHCLPGDSLVATSYGTIRIETLLKLRNKPEVLSYNHETKKLEWKRIVAAASQPGKPVVEITLSTGDRMRCTTDHFVYGLERGYVQAGDLVRGETVIHLAKVQEMRSVRGGNVSCGNLQSMLSVCSRREVQGEMRLLRQRVFARAVCRKKDNGDGQRRSLLLKRVQPTTSCREASSDLFELRQANQNQDKPLLRGVLSRTSQGDKATSRADMSILPNKVSSLFSPDQILFEQMRGLCPLDQDARQGQQPLQDRNQLRRLVPQDATCRLGTRRAMLHNLWGRQRPSDVQAGQWDSDALDACRSSHRRERGQQCTGQPDYAMSRLPHDAPQGYGGWQTDTISSVTRLGTTEERVYDIQVEGNRNFFADGILVHNCGIIDDAVKNAEEAASPTIRARNSEWYGSTFYTRGEPENAIIYSATRWHEADLGGWLLSEENDEEPEHWHIVNLPAIAEEAPQAFPATCTVEADFRQPGEALCPERYDLDKLNKLERRVGSYFWNALFQQRPSAIEGAILRRHWWRFWAPKGVTLPPVYTRLPDGAMHEHIQVELPDEFDEVLQSWDMSFKETKTSDFVAGQVWGKVDANKFLLDQVLERMDMVKTIAAVLSMSAKWPDAYLKLIEDKANGPAVISMLRDKITGLVAVEPDGSKESRVHASAPEIESGNVYLPHPLVAPWVNAFMDSAAAFPNAAHDDDVDSMTQALRRWGMGTWYLA